MSTVNPDEVKPAGESASAAPAPRERRSAAATPAPAAAESAAAEAPAAKPAKARSPVVRALDLGWGFTKLSRRNEDGTGLDYMTFPSLAPRASTLDLSSSVLGQRNTKVVTVDGVNYEVGPDSGDLDSNEANRNLNSNFIYTEQYKAVFYGALAYMDEPTIDVLVVGLPVSNMNQAPKLKAMMEGTHKVTGELTVVVKEALVVAQPLGGLHYCFSLAAPDTPFEFLREENNLLVDPGFLTFDFLYTHGPSVVENRSGACPGGVSKVLMALAQSISQAHGITYENLTAIDRGLRKRKIKIMGADEELEPHIRNTRDVLESTVNYMRNRVGDGSDVDNIILMGGGAALFRRTIETFYPRHKLIVVPNAQTANVTGFQLAGEAHVRAKR